MVHEQILFSYRWWLNIVYDKFLHVQQEKNSSNFYFPSNRLPKYPCEYVKKINEKENKH